MIEYEIKPLDADTWPDFARLAEANNGVWGGCWCMWYHRKDSGETAEQKREAKEQLVREGRAHAVLVFHGDTCVGWCQFGSPQELPCIHNMRAYFATNPALPDWRITCFFSGKGYRGKGVADAALKGAVEQIRQLGGGIVDVRAPWLRTVAAHRKAQMGCDSSYSIRRSHMPMQRQWQRTTCSKLSEHLFPIPVNPGPRSHPRKHAS